MKELNRTVYCDKLGKNTKAIIPYMVTDEGTYIKGIANGCKYQPLYNCNIELCPISKAQNEAPNVMM